MKIWLEIHKTSNQIFLGYINSNPVNLTKEKKGGDTTTET